LLVVLFESGFALGATGFAVTLAGGAGAGSLGSVGAGAAVSVAGGVAALSVADGSPVFDEHALRAIAIASSGVSFHRFINTSPFSPEALEQGAFQPSSLSLLILKSVTSKRNLRASRIKLISDHPAFAGTLPVKA
jgi:hypothetical protein